MADFDKLQQMDIAEVHRKTRITLARLQDIVEKRFDNIDPTRAHGFIKILERELQLNLSEWVKEYDTYRNPQMQKDSNVTQDNMENKELYSSNEVEKDTESRSTVDGTIVKQVTLKQKRQQTSNNKQQLSNMNIEINMPKQQVSYKTIIAIAVFFIVALLIVIGIYLIGSSNTQEKLAVEQNNTQKKAVEKDISQTYSTISLYEALNDKEDEREKSNTASKTEQPIEQAQQNQTKDDINEIDSKNIQTNNTTHSKQIASQTTELTITPKQDVWFAWVDTETKMRGEKYTKTPITLTIGNKMAFHFGYAVLSIEVDGQTFDYNQKGVTYMLYDRSQGIKLITQKEYRALGGR